MPSQKKIKDILALSGEVRGDVLKTDFKYVLEVHGRKEFDQLNREIKKIQGNLIYHKISNISWYPVGWKVIIMELGKELFDWKKKDFYELGRSASSNSFLTRTILRYFTSWGKIIQEVPEYWKKYWNTGTLEVHEKNLSEKYLVLRLKNFNIHPNLCFYLKGHFKSFAELALNSEVSIKEKKCPYKNKNDNFHEFLIKWQ